MGYPVYMTICRLKPVKLCENNILYKLNIKRDADWFLGGTSYIARSVRHHTPYIKKVYLWYSLGLGGVPLIYCLLFALK